ncbi:MAG: sigma-70 family RNA polymerase sigma factor [Clostridia bacterium]|nr:sigma-70 family RNA polymerase sigma factor [Clostridia bacterium]
MEELENKSDETLVELSRSGDALATEELMLRYKETVRRCARKFSFNLLAEVDDLVQEGMIGLYSAIGSFSAVGGRKFKNFVYTCVVRRIYSYLRFVNRRKPEGERTEIDPENLAEGESPEELLLIGESEGEFRQRLMRALSDFEFRVIMMYLEGMSYAQISEVTGKEVKSIDNALARAKRKLQSTFR